MFSALFNLLFLFVAATALADEPTLSNILQLTSPDRGFKRAGEAYFSPDGRKISFQGIPEMEDDFHIYTLDSDTNQLLKISQGDGACTCSYFKPDGRRMIFAESPEKATKHPPGTYKWDLTRYMNIYETDLDGSNRVQLTYGSAYHAEGAYSPDGQHIVYAREEDGSMNIYVMKRNGTEVQQVTHTTHCYNGGPFFSPDGSKIIFRADREVPHYLQIYMIDRDGSNLVQLTNNRAVNWAPFWHPSGKAIAYTSSLQGHHNYQIYFLNIETGDQFQITDAPGFNGLPTFNVSGTQILWTSKRGPDKSSQIFIADFNMPEKWLNP